MHFTNSVDGFHFNRYSRCRAIDPGIVFATNTVHLCPDRIIHTISLLPIEHAEL